MIILVIKREHLQKNTDHCVCVCHSIFGTSEFGTLLVNKQIIVRAKGEKFFNLLKRLKNFISTMYRMKRTCAYIKKQFEYLFFQEDKHNSSRFPGFPGDFKIPVDFQDFQEL